MNPEVLRNAPEMVLDEIAWHASELTELLEKVKKAPITHKNIVAGIFSAAMVELERRGIIVDFEAGDDNNQAEV